MQEGQSRRQSPWGQGSWLCGFGWAPRVWSKLSYWSSQHGWGERVPGGEWCGKVLGIGKWAGGECSPPGQCGGPRCGVSTEWVGGTHCSPLQGSCPQPGAWVKPMQIPQSQNQSCAHCRAGVGLSELPPVPTLSCVEDKAMPKAAEMAARGHLPQPAPPASCSLGITEVGRWQEPCSGSPGMPQVWVGGTGRVALRAEPFPLDTLLQEP